MTPEALRLALDQMHVSQRQLSRNLDISDRQIRYFCAGDEMIPRVVHLAVKYLQEHPEEILP